MQSLVRVTSAPYSFEYSCHLACISHTSVVVDLQVYVDSAPIAYPMEYILKFSVAFVIGGVLLVVYLWYLREHHTHRLRRLGPLCPEPQDVLHEPGNYPPEKYHS